MSFSLSWRNDPRKRKKCSRFAFGVVVETRPLGCRYILLVRAGVAVIHHTGLYKHRRNLHSCGAPCSSPAERTHVFFLISIAPQVEFIGFNKWAEL